MTCKGWLGALPQPLSALKKLPSICPKIEASLSESLSSSLVLEADILSAWKFHFKSKSKPNHLNLHLFLGKSLWKGSLR